jgi:AcrR family transcriptional regulator
MAEGTRRRYHSPARQRQAEQTKARILGAARDLFRTAGYASTTVEAIASAAQVSAKTVEAVFGSKRGVLAALVDPLASAGPPRDLIDQLRTAASPERRLELVAELSRRAYEGSVPEFELMRGAAAIGPEIAAVAEQVEARRRDNQARLIGYLRQQRRLRDGLTDDQATDIVWALTSYDVYRSLVLQRSWTPPRYQGWLTRTLVASLLAEAGRQGQDQHVEHG